MMTIKRLDWVEVQERVEIDLKTGKKTISSSSYQAKIHPSFGVYFEVYSDDDGKWVATVQGQAVPSFIGKKNTPSLAMLDCQKAYEDLVLFQLEGHSLEVEA